MEDEKISIYELLLLHNYFTHKNQTSGSSLGTILAVLGYDPNLKEDDKSKELQAKCKELGLSGWVISPYWEVNLSKGETIPYTWYEKLKSNSADAIQEYFTMNNNHLLIDIIARSYLSIPHRFYMWIYEAKELFFEKRYISCAMMLTAILEGSIRECPVEVWRQQVTKFYDEAVTQKLQNAFDNEYKQLLNKFYEYLVVLSSLDGYIKSFFDGKKPFDKKVEPDYLERNWLMHGMTHRKITEIDCIKLFNAISTLAFLTENLNHQK
ncbi:hypothetical protein [Paenibacillus ginsengarvi]|uniref:Uncharacterized protein n=1 Tax=Paenibacillus ginsengarvi TaxID=400777 RepID=A0A3B0C084_9BACL|nr:hypothetical protein [Paenibacillus ginsengarvi]RKN77086.1 hypothetical protein D7M11_23985 [Paenibacillus ginsengarvi]